MDPHHLDADPDSPYHPDADPDSNFYLLRFPIRIFIDSDADQIFHPVSDPDPGPSFEIKAQTFEKALK